MRSKPSGNEASAFTLGRLPMVARLRPSRSRPRGTTVPRRTSFGRRTGRLSRQPAGTSSPCQVLPPAAVRNDPRLDTLQQVAEQYAPALELLDRATRLDARGLDYGDDTIYGFPNRSLADVNALRIARLAFLGESEAASQALVGTLRIRRAYADVRGLNSPLDSGASLRLILSFAPPAEPGLRALQQEYSKWDVENEIEDRLVDMRARLIGAVWPEAPGEMPVTPRLRDPQDRGRTPRPVDLVLRPWVTRGLTRLLRQYRGSARRGETTLAGQAGRGPGPCGALPEPSVAVSRRPRAARLQQLHFSWVPRSQSLSQRTCTVGAFGRHRDRETAGCDHRIGGRTVSSRP